MRTFQALTHTDRHGIRKYRSRVKEMKTGSSEDGKKKRKHTKYRRDAIGTHGSMRGHGQDIPPSTNVGRQEHGVVGRYHQAFAIFEAQGGDL